MTSKDPEAFDWFLMSLTQQHGGSGQDLLDTIFSFLGRKTEFYTATSVGSARKVVLEKFDKYGADAMEAEEKKRKDLEAATPKQKERAKVVSRSSHGSVGIPILSNDTTRMAGKNKTKSDYDNKKEKGTVEIQPSYNSGKKDVLATYRTSQTFSQFDLQCVSETCSGFPLNFQHTAVAVEKAIYSFGSNTEAGEGFLKVYVLNIKESEMKWKLLSVPINQFTPTQRLGHTAVAYKEFVFIFGGYHLSKYSNKTYRFNTNTLRWEGVEVCGKKPEARAHHSAVVVKNQLIVFGGGGSGVKDDSSNLEGSGFAFKGTLPSRLWSHSATVYKDLETNNEFIFVFGGHDAADRRRISNELFCFNVNLKEWTQPKTSGTIPMDREGHSAFALNGYIVIFGGKYYVGSWDDFCFYNPKTCEWKEGKLCHQPFLPGDSRCVAVDDRVFVFGGTLGVCPYDTFIIEMRNKESGEKVIEQDPVDTHTDDLLLDVLDEDARSDESSGNVTNNHSPLRHDQVQDPRKEMSGSTNKNVTRIQAETSVSKLPSEKTSKCLTTKSTFVTKTSAPSPPVVVDYTDSAEKNKPKVLLKRRSSRNRNKSEIPGKKPKDTENQSSSSSEELCDNRPTITYPPTIEINTGLAKVKIESDYIPVPKIEPDQ